jgi:hypothetical protein
MNNNHAQRHKTWFMGRQNTPEQHIGDRSERRFEQMVNGMIGAGYLPWAQSVARANSQDDMLKGIDFWIRAIARESNGSTCEFSIPIQVKTSREQAEQFIKEKGDAVPVVIMGWWRTQRSLARFLSIEYKKKSREQLKAASRL